MAGAASDGLSCDTVTPIRCKHCGELIFWIPLIDGWLHTDNERHHGCYLSWCENISGLQQAEPTKPTISVSVKVVDLDEITPA